jgi:hypothetical protein
MLEKVKLNGHNGGHMELTLMCNWVMTHLIYEYILTLPDDAHELKKSYIDRIIKTEAHDNRGGTMSELAMYRAAALADNNVTLPCCVGKPFNISRLLPDGSADSLVLQYLQQLWPELNVVHDNSMAEGIYLYHSKAC